MTQPTDTTVMATDPPTPTHNITPEGSALLSSPLLARPLLLGLFAS